jgi:hypothetical protein
MPRRIAKKERGVDEKVPRFGYLADPIQERWCGASREGRPAQRRDQALRDSQGGHSSRCKDAGEYEGQGHQVLRDCPGSHRPYVNHDRRDVRNFKGRIKFILEAFADRAAEEIKPSDIDAWISSHKWSAATKNRYKNVFGKTFKIALADGKVTSNPARLVEQRAENNARIRLLSEGEKRDCVRRSRDGSQNTCRNSMYH